MINIGKPLVLVSLLIGWSFSVFGQKFSKDFWHKGEIDLKDGQTLKALIKYDLSNESIQITYENVVRSYSPQTVEAFQFVDELSQRLRFFYALPHKKSGNFSQLNFYELLVEGDFTLFVRERIVERLQASPYPYYYGYPRYYQTVQEDDFFLMDKKTGNILPIEFRREKQFYEKYMKDKEEEMKNYAKENRLAPYQRNEMIKLVEYYNSLKN